MSHDYAKSPLMEAEDSNSSMASAKATPASGGATSIATAKPDEKPEQEEVKKEDKVSKISLKEFYLF